MKARLLILTVIIITINSDGNESVHESAIVIWMIATYLSKRNGEVNMNQIHENGTDSSISVVSGGYVVLAPFMYDSLIS